MDVYKMFPFSKKQCNECTLISVILYFNKKSYDSFFARELQKEVHF
jgi:hypothetical protein